MLIKINDDTIYNTETGGTIDLFVNQGKVITDTPFNGQRQEFYNDLAKVLWDKLCQVADLQMDILQAEKWKADQL